MSQRTYILLARAGDIISLLPILWRDNENGQRSALMVAKEYAPILDGVSYCDPLVFDGQPHQIAEAVAKAREHSDQIVCCQVAGPPDVVKRFTYDAAGTSGYATDCFEREAWRIAGRFGDWYKGLPLVFDRRDIQREEKLIQQHIPKRKKVILLAAGGNSSPFPYKDLLYELLRLKYSRYYQIVDVSAIQAEHIYDLLGIYEHPQVHCLVAADSAPLHLAYGAKLPVVALVNDRPSLWYGSAWRPNHIAHIRYHDFPSRILEMFAAIDNCGKPGFQLAVDVPSRKIIHAWNHYELNDHNASRNKAAKENWKDIYKSGRWISSPIESGVLGQDSTTALGDPLRFPQLVPAINTVALRANLEDVICLTRCDTELESNITDTLLTGPLPCYSHRVIRDKEGDTYHPSIDLFAFTKEWWIAHRDNIEKALIIGFDPHWNRLLMEYFKKAGGTEIFNSSYRQPAPVIVLSLDKPPPHFVHNEKILKTFLDANKITRTEPAISEQLPCVMPSRSSLFPNAYNPSIIRHNGRILMAYRYHPVVSAETKLGIAELTDRGAVKKNKSVFVQCRSGEDPKLFEYRGELWMSYIDSNMDKQPFTAAVRYCKIDEGENEWTSQQSFTPKYNSNGNGVINKNWVPIIHGDDKYFIFGSQPHTVLKVNGDEVVGQFNNPAVRWNYGYIKGGTPPVPYGDKWLRFFHSRLDNEAPPYPFRYYVGACLMNPEPPFEITAISKEPILRGSEDDSIPKAELFTCHHRKERVVFPGGCITTEGGWILGVGINDCAIGLVKVMENGLNFFRHE